MFKYLVIGAIVLMALPSWADEFEDLKSSHIECAMEWRGIKGGNPSPIASCDSEKFFNKGFVFSQTKVGGVKVQFWDRKSNKSIRATVYPPKDYTGPADLKNMFMMKSEAARAWIFDEIRKGGYEPGELRVQGYYLPKDTILYKKNVYDGCKSPSNIGGCVQKYSSRELKQLELGTAGGPPSTDDRAGIEVVPCPKCGKKMRHHNSEEVAKKSRGKNRLPASWIRPPDGIMSAEEIHARLSRGSCPNCPPDQTHNEGASCINGQYDGGQTALVCGRALAGLETSPACYVEGHPRYKEPHRGFHTQVCTASAICDLCVNGKVQKNREIDVFCRPSTDGQTDRAMRPACGMSALECARDNPKDPLQRSVPLYSYGRHFHSQPLPYQPAGSSR